jgi:RimJ/RimL family protein N-acetyltransferase
MMKIIFETERLILREFTLADTGLLLKLNTSPEVLRYIHEPALKDEAHALEILENTILPQYQINHGRWAIHTRKDGAFIGWCGLKFLAETQTTDLGYRLLPGEWGKGYATESAKECIQYGFTQLHIEEIFGKAHIDNTASIRVLEKTGMNYLGISIEDDTEIKIYQVKNPNP